MPLGPTKRGSPAPWLPHARQRRPHAATCYLHSPAMLAVQVTPAAAHVTRHVTRHVTCIAPMHCGVQITCETSAATSPGSHPVSVVADGTRGATYCCYTYAKDYTPCERPGQRLLQQQGAWGSRARWRSHPHTQTAPPASLQPTPQVPCTLPSPPPARSACLHLAQRWITWQRGQPVRVEHLAPGRLRRCRLQRHRRLHWHHQGGRLCVPDPARQRRGRHLHQGRRSALSGTPQHAPAGRAGAAVLRSRPMDPLRHLCQPAACSGRGQAQMPALPWAACRLSGPASTSGSTS